MRLAKSMGISIILVGHVTKGGPAGSKVLEHAVDYVLYFEGARQWSGSSEESRTVSFHQ